jgi:hypothetical protein
MLSPDELIGQKVWVDVKSDPLYVEVEPVRIQAEITQPTSPPWFFARYLNPPRSTDAAGQWLTLHEAQLAVLTNPVVDYDELEYLDEFDNEYDEPDGYLNLLSK